MSEKNKPNDMPSVDEIVAATKRHATEVEKHKADLKARSKPLHELVQTAYFRVNGVVGQSYATEVDVEQFIGEHSSAHPAGHTSGLVLKVTAEDASIPVKELIFSGFSAVRGGDRVKALIPRYAAESEESYGLGLFSGENTPTHNVDRPYQPEEHAIELTIMEADREVRIDRSVDYWNFVRKSG